MKNSKIIMRRILATTSLISIISSISTNSYAVLYEYQEPKGNKKDICFLSENESINLKRYGNQVGNVNFINTSSFTYTKKYFKGNNDKNPYELHLHNIIINELQTFYHVENGERDLLPIIVDTGKSSINSIYAKKDAKGKNSNYLRQVLIKLPINSELTLGGVDTQFNKNKNNFSALKRVEFTDKGGRLIVNDNTTLYTEIEGSDKASDSILQIKNNKKIVFNEKIGSKKAIDTINLGKSSHTILNDNVSSNSLNLEDNNTVIELKDNKIIESNINKNKIQQGILKLLGSGRLITEQSNLKSVQLNGNNSLLTIESNYDSFILKSDIENIGKDNNILIMKSGQIWGEIGEKEKSINNITLEDGVRLEVNGNIYTNYFKGQKNSNECLKFINTDIASVEGKISQLKQIEFAGNGVKFLKKNDLTNFKGELIFSNQGNSEISIEDKKFDLGERKIKLSGNGAGKLLLKGSEQHIKESIDKNDDSNYRFTIHMNNRHEDKEEKDKENNVYLETEQVAAGITGHYTNVFFDKKGSNIAFLGEKTLPLKRVVFNQNGIVDGSVYVETIEVTNQKTSKFNDKLFNSKLTMDGENSQSLFSEKVLLEKAIIAANNKNGILKFSGGAEVKYDIGTLDKKINKIYFDKEIELHRNVYSNNIYFKHGSNISVRENITLSGSISFDSTDIDLRYGKNLTLIKGNSEVHGNSTISIDCTGQNGNIVIGDGGKLNFDNNGKFIIKGFNLGDLLNDQQISLMKIKDNSQLGITKEQIAEKIVIEDGYGNNLDNKVASCMLKNGEVCIKRHKVPEKKEEHKPEQLAQQKKQRIVPKEKKTAKFYEVQAASSSINSNNSKKKNSQPNKSVQSNSSTSNWSKFSTNYSLSDSSHSSDSYSSSLDSEPLKNDVLSKKIVTNPPKGIIKEHHNKIETHRHHTNNYTHAHIAGINQGLDNHISPIITPAINNNVGVNAGEEEKSFGIWGSPVIQKAKQREDKNHVGYSSMSYGGTIGYDTNIGNNLLVGGAVSLIDSKLKYNNIGHTKINSYLISIYSVKTLENNFFCQGIFNMGMGNVVNANRKSNNISKYNLMLFLGEAKIGHNFVVKDKLIITPIIGASYSQVSSSGYKEHTMGSTDTLSIKGGNSYKLDLITGLRVSSRPIISKNYIIITSELHGFIKHGLINKASMISIAGLDSDTRLERATKLNRTMYNIGTGVTVSHSNIDYRVTLDTNFAKKYFGVQGVFKVRVSL